MEHSQQSKTLASALVIIVIIVAGYFFFIKDKGPSSNGIDEAEAKKPMTAEVEKTPMKSGVLSAPVGLPKGIPIEEGAVTESTLTTYPEYGAKQLSVSYRSSKTVTAKYAEFKSYMQGAGYTVNEGDPKASVRSLSGAKADANLSVVLSTSDGKTLVQISYLLK